VSTTRLPALGFVAAAVLAAAAWPEPIAADQGGSATAASSLTVSVTFSPRMTLRAGSELLTFHVVDGTPAEATVDFSAGLRIPTGSVVALAAQADAPMSGVLTVVASDEDSTPVLLTPAEPTDVAQWVGSGLRTGRLTVRLQAPPGVYQVPVRLTLVPR
jgi:hypothetical protein